MEDKKNKHEDDAFYLLKSLYHIGTAKGYLEMIAEDATYNGKNLFNRWINKMNWIISDVYSRLSKQGQMDFIQMFSGGDTIFHEAISEKLLRLSEEQKKVVETLVDGMIKGEKVEFEKEVI